MFLVLNLSIYLWTGELTSLQGVSLFFSINFIALTSAYAVFLYKVVSIRMSSFVLVLTSPNTNYNGVFQNVFWKVKLSLSNYFKCNLLQNR